MIIWFYQFLVTFLEIICFPFLHILFKNKNQLQRLAFHNKKLRKSIWFHAASVGEVNALKPLLLKVLNEQKGKDVILTTMTETGQKTAVNISAHLNVTYSPIDLPGMVARFFNRIDPALIIIMETELWPQMLLKAKKRKVPVLIVNGRLTEKSLVNYQKSVFFWKHIFPTLTKVNTQSEEDKNKFIKLGVDQVENTGNLKFAVQLKDHSKNDLRASWNIDKDDFVVVFGSSRPGEEKLIFDSLVQLKNSIKKLKLIIVPRHLKRIEEVQKLGASHDAELLSKYDTASGFSVLIVDKMGVLTELYALSDIAIIGGSFFDFGGHNPLEAAFYSVPVIIGKYHSSCKQSVDMLKSDNAVLISDTSTLPEDIIRLYKEKSLRNQMGKHAKELLDKHAMVLERNYNTIQNLLK